MNTTSTAMIPAITAVLHLSGLSAPIVAEMRLRRPMRHLDRVNEAVDGLSLPEAAFKTCPWEPRDLVVEGLRQWLRCCGAALRDGQVIGMPSRAIDEAWHGLILCTPKYARFCKSAYGQFLHHYPDGTGPPASAVGCSFDQLRRTVVAWTMVAREGETCVMWDLDRRVGVEDPWGMAHEDVTAVLAELG